MKLEPTLELEVIKSEHTIKQEILEHDPNLDQKMDICCCRDVKTNITDSFDVKSEVVNCDVCEGSFGKENMDQNNTEIE